MTVREFKNLFNNIHNEDIEFLIKSNIGNMTLDLVSYEVNSDNLDLLIHIYIFKPIFNNPSILNSLTNINDIFINGKNEYDLIQFNIINNDGNVLEIKLDNIIKENNSTKVEFNI